MFAFFMIPALCFMMGACIAGALSMNERIEDDEELMKTVIGIITVFFIILPILYDLVLLYRLLFVF